MARTRKDASLTVTTALPATNATVNSAPIDFESAAPGVTLEAVELQIEVPATPALADAKTITIKLQDSDDGVTYADIDSLASIVLTGADATGADAVDRTYKLPASTRRYVRTTATAMASAGDSTGVSYITNPLF